MRFSVVPAVRRLRILRPLALACLVLPTALPAYAATNATLPEGVAKSLKANKISQQSLSVVTLPLNGPGNGTIFNADVSVNPASTMKLVTTFAALELLGPTYQWKTEFYTDGQLKNGVLNGNLYLKGGGDPKLNMEKLWLMLRDLRANGVRQVTGDLVLDRGYFVQPDLPAFNDDGGDANKPYLVTPDSLLVNLKALRFIARAEDGKVSVAAEPPLAGLKLDNQVKVLKAGKCPAWPDVRYNPVKEFDGTRVIVTGQLTDGCSAQTYLSLLDHPSYAAGAVRAIFSELGGSILGKDRQAEVPKSATLLARAFSPDLVEIIRDINKYSNNVMARQVLLTLGAEMTGQPGDTVNAARAVRGWLNDKGIDTNGLAIENGAGLSRVERVTPALLASVLVQAYRSPLMPEFVSSLPLVGYDGTMRRRLKTQSVAGQAHIKTGTLNDVRSIAGYVQAASGKTYVVVFLINHAAAPNGQQAQDALLQWVYENG